MITIYKKELNLQCCISRHHIPSHVSQDLPEQPLTQSHRPARSLQVPPCKQWCVKSVQLQVGQGPGNVGTGHGRHGLQHFPKHL